MPSYPLNNVTAPDNAPTAASTLDPLPVCDHINLDVTNAAIFWSIKQTNNLTSPQTGAWQPYVYMAPGSRPIQRFGIVGFRFYAAVPQAQLPVGGLQAQVTAEAVEL